jgi:hypothetical protein
MQMTGLDLVLDFSLKTLTLSLVTISPVIRYYQEGETGAPRLPANQTHDILLRLEVLK